MQLNKYIFQKILKNTKSTHKTCFEELLGMQIALLNLKKENTQDEGISFPETVKMSNVINELPFKLTKAQLRVLEEIDGDMEKVNQ